MDEYNFESNIMQTMDNALRAKLEARQRVGRQLEALGASENHVSEIQLENDPGKNVSSIR